MAKKIKNELDDIINEQYYTEKKDNTNVVVPKYANRTTPSKFTILDQRVHKLIPQYEYPENRTALIRAAKAVILNKPMYTTNDNDQYGGNIDEAYGEGSGFGDELFKVSLGYDGKLDYISKSKYKPSVVKDGKTTEYFQINDLDRREFLDKSLNEFDGMLEGNSKVVNWGSVPTKNEKNTHGLANFTISKGADEKGKYISYYDKYDFDTEIVNKYLDKTPEIYDRVYYEDNPYFKKMEKVYQEKDSLWDIDTEESRSKALNLYSKIDSLYQTAKADGSGIKKYRPVKEQDPIEQYFLPGQNLKFLGGLTGAQAVSGGGQAAGMLSGMINPNTRGGGATSGALQGASMGAMLGPYGMAAGAVLGGVAGLISGGKAADHAVETEFNTDIKQRNQMLGLKAMGGQLTEFNTGGSLTEFNVGGSHSENIYGGIPQGVDAQGIPNKVEQGETKWQDYIFSDLLLLDQESVTSLNLPNGVAGKTFAEASKKLSKLSKERPNDPITKSTVKGHMDRLMAANDGARQMEESQMMSQGGHLYNKGGLKLPNFSTQLPETEYGFGKSNILSQYMPMPLGADNTPLDSSIKKTLNFKLSNPANSLLNSGANVLNKNNIDLSFLKDEKNLRYAPIAFDALAGMGVFGKAPTPKEFSPTLVHNTGQLTPQYIDEMQMRNQVDNAFQTGASGLAEASGGSGSALRAGLSGLNADYMSGVGKAYAQSNQANMASKMGADQFNLQSQAETAARNAQMINHAGMLNTQNQNQSVYQNYDNRMSYLAKGAEGLGDVGYEARMSELMPKLYGYNQFGNYQPKLNACGGRLRLKHHKK